MFKEPVCRFEKILAVLLIGLGALMAPILAEEPSPAADQTTGYFENRYQSLVLEEVVQEVELPSNDKTTPHPWLRQAGKRGLILALTAEGDFLVYALDDTGRIQTDREPSRLPWPKGITTGFRAICLGHVPWAGETLFAFSDFSRDGDAEHLFAFGFRLSSNGLTLSEEMPEDPQAPAEENPRGRNQIYHTDVDRFSGTPASLHLPQFGSPTDRFRQALEKQPELLPALERLPHVPPALEKEYPKLTELRRMAISVRYHRSYEIADGKILVRSLPPGFRAEPRTP